MIKALTDDPDPEGSQASESTIMGLDYDDPSKGESAIWLATLNHRGQLTTIVLQNAQEVIELCAGLQAASEAIFGDGDMQPELTLPN